ncbi:MAG: hypothetical protein P8X94_05940, partial [Woeseiaceae bacterium]
MSGTATCDDAAIAPVDLASIDIGRRQGSRDSPVGQGIEADAAVGRDGGRAGRVNENAVGRRVVGSREPELLDVADPGGSVFCIDLEQGD